jgi:hypothetical protein
MVAFIAKMLDLPCLFSLGPRGNYTLGPETRLMESVKASTCLPSIGKRLLTVIERAAGGSGWRYLRRGVV